MKSDGRRFLIAIALLFTGNALLAQNFTWRREIKDVHSTWHCLEIPPAVVGKCKEGLIDLRVLTLQGKDTAEVPYLVNFVPQGPVIKEIPHTIIDRSEKDGKRYATIEIEKTGLISEIELIFQSETFDSELKLEGSNTNTDWFTIIDKQRVGAVTIEGKFYRYSTLNFDLSSYKYYRISLPTGTPDLLNVSIKTSTQQKKRLLSLPVIGVDHQGVQIPHQTRMEISLGGKYPLERIRINVDSTLDYYRPVSIYAATDSVFINGKYRFDYEPIANGLLTSWTENEFAFERINVSRILVEISNGDNEPLKLKQPDLLVSPTSITIRFKKTKGDHFLFYGNKELTEPDYELTYFKDKIPGSVPQLRLGEEQDVRKPLKTRSPLDLSTTWLWAVLGLIMVAMAGFVVNMWRKKD